MRRRFTAALAAAALSVSALVTAPAAGAMEVSVDAGVCTVTIDQADAVGLLADLQSLDPVVLIALDINPAQVESLDPADISTSGVSDVATFTQAEAADALSDLNIGLEILDEYWTYDYYRLQKIATGTPPMSEESFNETNKFLGRLVDFPRTAYEACADGENTEFPYPSATGTPVADASSNPLSSSGSSLSSSLPF